MCTVAKLAYAQISETSKLPPWLVTRLFCYAICQVCGSATTAEANMIGHTAMGWFYLQI
jgi:hypothetical protein